jgi:hypothetical protein
MEHLLQLLIKHCMKKIFVLALFISGAAVALAQKKREPNYFYNKRIHIGAKAGANMTKIDGRGFRDGFSYGFHAGGFVQVKLAGPFSIQGEVLFSQMVADTARDLSEVVDYIRFSETRSQLRLSYLDIPVMLNIGVGPARALKLQAGVQYGLLMNKSQTLLQNGQNAFKSGQFSAIGGVMIQLAAIHLGGRYTVGLDNLNNVTNVSRWKSQTGQFFVGVTF